MNVQKKAEQTSRLEKDDGVWMFTLYVTGAAEKTNKVSQNLSKFCSEQLPDRCKIEVVDVIKHPEMAIREQIVAIPTLIKKRPLPIRRVIGDLSNTERVRTGLGL